MKNTRFLGPLIRADQIAPSNVVPFVGTRT